MWGMLLFFLQTYGRHPAYFEGAGIAIAFEVADPVFWQEELEIIQV